MGILTEDMQRVVEEQRLGFVATVCADGTPNVSPKGTLAVWDDNTLVFADIQSPQTIRNIRQHPAVEANVVDPLARRGYRFKGTARIVSEGDEFKRMLSFYHGRDVDYPIRHIVVIAVERALALTSPAYAIGKSEAELRAAYWARFETLNAEHLAERVQP
jgi:hypothetical protein